MKLHIKTPSKNLVKLMRSGENTPAHPTSHDLNDVDFAENTEETNIEDELQQLDVASFERILRSIAASKTDLLKDESTGIDPAIMGLIDDAKERLTAETDRNNTLRPNDQPVKFDDVFDYIDDGVEEVVIEKPPVVVAKKVATMIKPPVRGNPVTDYDKLNEMNGFHEHYENLDKDIVSRMEMGHAQAFDDVDLEKLTKCQKNIRCDEKEQMDWLEQKGLTEFSKYDTILGPVSKGEFVSYNQTSTQAVGCDIGVMNPISVKNMNVFKTVIPMGHLVKSVPRLFFLPNDSSPKPTRKPGGITSVHKPFTMMLKTVSPSHFTTQVPESQLLNLHMQPEKEEANVQKENINQKKRKSKSKKTSEPSLNVDSDEMNSSVEDIDKQGKDIVDDEKENKEDGLTEQEREARRIRNVKNRNKKKQKKAVEKKLEEARKESDTPVDPQSTLLDSSRKLVKSGRESIPFGAPSSNQDKMTKDLPNGANRRVLGGKSKKNMKSVSSEYTVENDSSPDLLQAASGVETNLVDILKEFGINDLSELNEGGQSKKKQKANNNTNNSKKNKQQQNQKKDQKVVEKSGEEGKNKSPQTGGKKMDDVADAASVTKRCSSGVGQQSEEDDDQSYVSAQENLGGSNGSLSPNEFLDAQSREEVTDNVMSDPNNYRNDEDVPSLAQELHQRDLEFITVGKKKNKKQTSVQDNDFHSSTESSSSPTNRRNTHPDARVSSITGNSASGSNQHQKKNIPSAPLHTFGDFCDIDKGIGKNKKASGPSPCSSQKKHASVDKSEPLEFVDAPETPMTINTAHTFSYADAAKKSSGENTPALDMSPIPQSATNSSASSVRNQASQSHAQSGSASNEKKKNTEKTPSRGAPSNKPSATIASGAVQLPPSVVGAVSDISFGYEETPEDVKKRQQKETKTAAAPQRPPKQTRMNGVDLLKSFTQQPENSGSKKETTLNEMPKNGLSEEHVLAAEILSAWQIRWDEFNTGKKPVVFKPAKTEKKSSPPPRQ